MAYAYSATITAGIPSNGLVTLTFTDNSTGISGLVSKVLNIYNYNNVPVATINMGSATVATYQTSADGYFTFALTTVDGNGTYNELSTFLCIAFYVSLYTVSVAGLMTYCGDLTGQIFNQSNAQNNRYAALDMASLGQGVISQQLITRANFLITTPYYA